MADCYYHGYSGGPGPCRECETEDRRGAKRGTVVAARPARPEPTRFTPSGRPRWDNDLLPAGSPMHYYCRKCGEESDVLPENWDPRERVVKNVCERCTQGLPPLGAVGGEKKARKRKPSKRT